MQTLLAVLDDLFGFARTSLFGVHKATMEVLQEPTIFGMQNRLPLLPSSGTHTPRLPSFAAPSSNDVTVGAIYFLGADTPLYTDPVVAFDVVITTIPYGSEVHVLKFGGRWAYIRIQQQEGWILKDVVREQARDVYPELQEGVQYTADNEETKKLRLYIHDSFGGDAASLLLTDAEYVTYELNKKNLFLPWDTQRPRTPGTWQKKLRGKSGIHMTVAPQPYAVMEYSIDDIGYVAFVEAAFPDMSIKLSAVGAVRDGVYSEQTFTQEEWKELRPVFISVH